MIIFRLNCCQFPLNWSSFYLPTLHHLTPAPFQALTEKNSGLLTRATIWSRQSLSASPSLKGRFTRLEHNWYPVPVRGRVMEGWRGGGRGIQWGAVRCPPLLSPLYPCLSTAWLTQIWQLSLSLSLSLSLLSSHEVERLGRHSEIPGCIWSPSYSGWTVQAGPGREVRGGGVGGCEGRGVSWVHCPALYRGRERESSAHLLLSCWPGSSGRQTAGIILLSQGSDSFLEWKFSQLYYNWVYTKILNTLLFCMQVCRLRLTANNTNHSLIPGKS